MEIINKRNFDETIAHGVVLVDFFATWCGPCKMLAPVLDGLAKEFEGKVKIVKVDVDEDQDLAMRYNVMSVPTMILFKDGAVSKQLQGFKPQAELSKELNAAL